MPQNTVWLKWQPQRLSRVIHLIKGHLYKKGKPSYKAWKPQFPVRPSWNLEKTEERGEKLGEKRGGWRPEYFPQVSGITPHLSKGRTESSAFSGHQHVKRWWRSLCGNRVINGRMATERWRDLAKTKRKKVCNTSWEIRLLLKAQCSSSSSQPGTYTSVPYLSIIYILSPPSFPLSHLYSQDKYF